MTEEILKRVDILAAKLGVTAAHLWEVLIRQSRIEAYECIAWGSIWMALCVFILRWGIGAYRKDEEDVPLVLGIIGGFLCFLIACIILSNTPGMLLNPEYWAFKQIAEALGAGRTTK